jgi:hypothetical protein
MEKSQGFTLVENFSERPRMVRKKLKKGKKKGEKQQSRG